MMTRLMIRLVSYDAKKKGRIRNEIQNCTIMITVDKVVICEVQ